MIASPVERKPAKRLPIAPSVSRSNDSTGVDEPRNLGRTAGGKLYLYLELPVVAIFCIGLGFYFNFTAEDAYIVYRYAENLVNTGSLVYNIGEPINAMTSPLHALLSAALYFATGQPVLANKIVGVVLLLLSALLVWRRYGSHPQWQLLAMILILLPPSMLLWAVGGLETPILLFLATLTVVLVDQPDAIRPSQLYVVFLLSGLAYVTRYDSILFFLPILLHAGLRAGSLRRLLLALTFGAILPLAWSVISVYYYGDLLPTSYYVKTPERSLRQLLHNGRYVASYLVFVGLVPALVMALPVALRRRTTAEVLCSHVRRLWWLYAASASELLYGLTIATHHMMFGFRFFVPYLPATAILVVDLVRQLADGRVAHQWPRWTGALLIAVFLCLTWFQVYQIRYSYLSSVNGISSRGEYQSLGVREYMKFIKLLKQEALDIEAHWTSTRGYHNRPPRIVTYAAGTLPYTFRDSYIYEVLVSYRRYCPHFKRIRQALHADYVHILAPRQGEIFQQLPKAESRYVLVSSYETYFDGSLQKFLVYYDPSPEGPNLSSGINGRCTTTGR